MAAAEHDEWSSPETDKPHCQLPCLAYEERPTEPWSVVLAVVSMGPFVTSTFQR